ncbi:unnamed protein product [Spirodela intermedia]|uniref:Uncharacterized protein n=1 Tax=Spirodela intermedia TaxID=51605 RepID=A0A7I8JHP5_SPIIN|nr:unnamed protein product [Spirodela intermedia]CAA6669654.1 unnamed protein product [Spirodela intermedia]
MLPTRSKSGLSEASNKAAPPATPRVSKLARTPSKSEPESPLRPSIDRSPKSLERRSPKGSTPPDKQARAAKGGGGAVAAAASAEAEEELKKVKELLVEAQSEKARAMEELKEAKRSAAEASGKLEEAIVAQKRAQESSEIEKFRADELEQAAIEAAQKREDEWQRELEGAHNQHAIDVSALLTITQELQRVKQELAMTTEAKNAALSHADDAMKIAEINAEKVGILSSEVGHLKGLLESKAEEKAGETAELVRRLNSEVESLKSELAGARSAGEQEAEMAAQVEALKIEVADAKRAESDAGTMMDEWKRKAELLEARVEEAIQSERAAMESVGSAMKKLEESNVSLQDAESEISSLKGKKEELDESRHRLEMSQEEVQEMERSIELLRSELRSSEEEKREAAEEAKRAAAAMESLAEDRSAIVEELEASRDEGEKNKRAMEGLASALHEVSTEARESQERILIKQAEVEEAHAEVERLKMALKTKDESYEILLNEAKEEISTLRSALEKSEQEVEGLRSALEEKELDPPAGRSEEEFRVLKEEMSELIVKLQGAEASAKAAKEEGDELLNRLRKAEADAGSANESVEAAKAENLQLKDRLLDKENELQSISQENDDLRAREAVALGKIQVRYLPKAAEIPEDGAAGRAAEKAELEESPGQQREANGSHKPSPPPPPRGDELVDEEANTWDNCHVDKDSSPQEEPESEVLDDGAQPRVDHVNGGSSVDAENGVGSSPTKQQQDPKKKKPLLRKFGNLLKKKSNPK